MIALTTLLALTPIQAAAEASSAADLVDVTTSICLALAAGEVKLGGALDDDERVLKSKNVSTGVRQATMDRMGRDGVDLLSKAIIGERPSGEDSVVLAVGGAMPSCRSILLSKTPGTHTADVARLLLASGWQEAPAVNAPGAAVARRMFVRRDGKGQPYLVNLLTGALPQSDFRLMTTVNAIPPGVQLPEGF